MAVPPNGIFRRSLLCLLIPLLIASPCPAETVTIRNAWISASPPVARATSGYFEIENHGHETVIIERISSPDYNRIEIHRSILSDGVARMQLQKEILVPAGSRFAFRPGGYHLMLYRNSKPLGTGESTTLTLHFSGGDTLPVTAEVRRRDDPHQH